MSWADLPRAAAILADCAKNPPATRMVKKRGLTTYWEEEYVGRLVSKLRAIRSAEGDRLIKQGDRARNYAAFDAHCDLTVQKAIEAAVAARRQRRAA